MTARPAISTPRPLPRKREAADRRPRLSLAGAVPAQASNDDVNSSGLTPAKAIQIDEAPLARRKTIQKKEGESDTRLATIARIEALRLEIRKLVEVIALGADIELLDLMRDEVGSYSRHKAAQEARTWAEQARLSIETGLMQLDRAINPMS
ncbi:hypothetical protein [Paraburkholderia terricola]|uniref:Uncharacterized protein n=1 Tax=Paraburkholderia terricola TaxID=169427 RepID=A0A1M6RJ86_9BURK|nr:MULTISPECIES: hypothetical protein [Paraburkholderia]SDO50412.1 hypothetical protein SAMN05192547_10182 [Paraburkholderia sediminicola]SHK32551.1 hypothetical protein SAMN05192548_10195 [Paraburkholderia terricola]